MERTSRLNAISSAVRHIYGHVKKFLAIVYNRKIVELYFVTSSKTDEQYLKSAGWFHPSWVITKIKDWTGPEMDWGIGLAFLETYVRHEQKNIKM